MHGAAIRIEMINLEGTCRGFFEGVGFVKSPRVTLQDRCCIGLKLESTIKKTSGGICHMPVRVTSIT